MGGIGCGMGRISGLLGFRFYFGAGVVGCCGNFVTRHGNTGCGRVGGGLGSSCGLLRCGSGGNASLLGFRLYFGAGVVGGCSNFVTRHGDLGCGRIGSGLGGCRGLFRSGVSGRFRGIGLSVLGFGLLCIGFGAVAGSQCGGGGENKY